MFSLLIGLFGVVIFSVVGCGDDNNTEDDTVNTIDSTTANNSMQLNIDGSIFSIPSPVQTAMLIKSSGATFDASILNLASNTPNYSTNFQKALNLGIYGADLGYVTLYDNSDQAISYLTSVQKLSDNLGLSGAFDTKLIERFSNNLGNQDSMLVVVADAYRSGDNYLKNNDRNEIAALIVAGGWLESLYFAAHVAKTDNNQEIINRIGEQKTSLYSLISLLTKYGNDEDYSDLTADLVDLYHAFDNVKNEYNYVVPETDDANQITHLKSTTKVIISSEDMDNIINSIQSIRNSITE